MTPFSTFAPTIQDDNGSNSPARFITQDVRAFASAAKSANTLRAYRQAMRKLSAWCATHGIPGFPVPSEIAAAYLTACAQAGMKPSSLNVALAAIRHYHLDAGLDDPTDHPGLRNVLRGIRRTVGTAPEQKQPVTAERMSAMLAHLGTGTRDLRDRALLLLGMAGALRRSELVALDIADLSETAHGLDMRIRRSKGDQEGHGHTIAIPHGESLRPVQAVRDWIAGAGIAQGPLFRPLTRSGAVRDGRLSAQSVALIVKQRALKAGLDQAAFSGHSLRAGFVTSAADRGADINRIMDQTRHADPRTVWAYIRRSDRYKDHAGAGFL